MKMEQSVPKRRHTNSRRRVITQKKAYTIQNTMKAWNQEYIRLLHTEDGVKRFPEASVTINGVDMTQHHSIRVFRHHQFENLTSRKMATP